jgi:cellulose synthase/poly-beta-1,6-N-acetylglucosamine synthase-like glycosyltransferase
MIFRAKAEADPQTPLADLHDRSLPPWDINDSPADLLSVTPDHVTANGDNYVRENERGGRDDRRGSPAGRGSQRHDLDDHGRSRRGYRGAHAVPASNHQGSEVVHRVTIAISATALGAAAYLAVRVTISTVLVGYWIFGAATIGICLLAFVRGRRFVNFPVARGRTLAIVPVYNEPRDKLHACVRSLLAQTVPLDKIIVVDDGSAEPMVPFDAPNVEWVRQANTGKRGAQVAALRRFDPSEFQFVMTVDSDSTPYPDALEHLLRAMSSRKVQAATGWIYVRNYRESLVARAADIDIGGSCVMMRASRSMLGAIETTSGALSLYRSEILYDNLEEYAVECGTGDDRWLTLRALLRGEVVGVYEAGVETDMPTTVRGTFRQRLRWARSWWWMLPFAYARLSWKQLLSPTIGLVEWAITPMLICWSTILWIAGLRIRLAHPGVALAFVAAFCVVRLALSVLYLAGRPGMSLGQKTISVFIGTPAAVLLNLFVLVPSRYYALARLKDRSWQTRQVKVKNADVQPATAGRA